MTTWPTCKNLCVDFAFTFTAVTGNSLELELWNMVGRQILNTSLNCVWNACCKLEIRNKEIAHIGDYILHLWQTETLTYTIILDTNCMQGIYSYIGYITLQLFCSYNLREMLCHFPCLAFCTVTLPHSAVSEHWQIWLFLKFLNFMLSRYVAQVLSVSEMVPVASVITGIIFAFTFHMRWIPILKSLHFKLFSFLSQSRFCLQKLQHLLTRMFPSYYHGLWRPVYC
jgi:hypothetical protein